jgi:hypothetical protein
MLYTVKNFVTLFSPTGSQDVAWMVDHNANLIWDGSPPDRLFYWGGVSGDIPVPGKW